MNTSTRQTLLGLRYPERAARSGTEPKPIEPGPDAGSRSRSLLTGRVMRRGSGGVPIEGVQVWAANRCCVTDSSGDYQLTLDGLEPQVELRIRQKNYLPLKPGLDWSAILAGGLLVRNFDLIAECDRDRFCDAELVLESRLEPEDDDAPFAIADASDDDLLLDEACELDLSAEDDELEAFTSALPLSADLDPDEMRLFGGDEWGADRTASEWSMERGEGQLLVDQVENQSSKPVELNLETLFRAPGDIFKRVKRFLSKPIF